MTKLWLVCYDIPDDKRRTKLAKLIEQHCQRVQYSVFECPLETNILSHLLVSSRLPSPRKGTETQMMLLT